jgi:excisionase family DNA binding protein
MLPHPTCTPPSDYPELLDPRQASEVLDVSEGTLAVWRSSKRYGLPYVKVGRKVRYRRADLIAWLEKRVQQLEHAL